MSLEIGTVVDDLVVTNPIASDPVGQGDDHLRLLKTCIKGTFPQMGGRLGQLRSQDISGTISAGWNTNHLQVSPSATTIVTLTLPPSASITTGFYIDISTIAGVSVVLTPAAGALVNAQPTFTLPEQSTCHAYFTGGLTWRTNSHPNAQLNNIFAVGIRGDSTLSISGAATFAGTVSISGAAHFKTTVSIGGAVTMASTLVVAGAVTISGATVLAGGVSISGNATASGNLTVAGTTTLSGAVTMTTNLTVAGTTTLSGATVLSGNLTVAGTTTLSGTVVLSNGQLVFPAVQNASAGANTLDDYEEGTFSAGLTFSTPGNQSIVISGNNCHYIKIGQLCWVSITLVTSTFTHTTASGNLTITNLPFNAAACDGPLAISSLVGLTQTGNNTQVMPYVAASSNSALFAFLNTTSGASMSPAIATTANHVSGVNVSWTIGGTYRTSA